MITIANILSTAYIVLWGGVVVMMISLMSKDI